MRTFLQQKRDNMETKGDRETKFETSKNFTDLLVWKKAHMFVLEVYQITQKYPDTERFALCSQFKRAANSIPANIAEGYKKLSKADKLRFMNIAQGSLEESRYYIILSRDLSYINEEEYECLTTRLEEASRLLNLYIKGLLEKRFND